MSGGEQIVFQFGCLDFGLDYNPFTLKISTHLDRNSKPEPNQSEINLVRFELKIYVANSCYNKKFHIQFQIHPEF